MADDNKKQPTILIKKADGTSVRISLAEFRKMRNGGRGTSDAVTTENSEQGTENTDIATQQHVSMNAQPVHTDQKTETNEQQTKDSEQEAVNNVTKEPEEDNTTSQPIEQNLQEEKKVEPPTPPADEYDVAKQHHDLPQVATPHELATTMPVENYFEHTASAQMHASDFDHTSLLEEDLSEIQAFEAKGARHVTQADIVKHDAKIQKNIVSDDAPQLTSLIASWKKGIRSDEQFLEYATRDRLHGGMGMTVADVQILLTDLKKEHEHGKGVADVVPTTNRVVSPRVPTIPMQKPRVSPPALTHEKKNSVYNVSSPEEVDILASYREKNIVHDTPAGVVHDVATGYERSTMGPEQEIAQFALVDFRRLSRDVDKARDMLQAKFDNWKKDDYMLFMNARDRWYESPLYRMYVSIGMQALNQHVPIETVLAMDKNGITVSEYMALVQMNTTLDV